MGVIIAGREFEVPGVLVRSWNQNPKFRLDAEEFKMRPNTWVRGIVLHTSKGIPGGKNHNPQKILPGLGPDTKRDERMAQMWKDDDRHAGSHLVCDHDASWTCLADLQTEAPFHAGNVNSVTIGIEIYQGGDASLYMGQLESVVVMVDWLTKKFAIQRQIPHAYLGHALNRGLRRGIDLVGVYGHRDCSDNRGSGDPGDTVMQLLRDAGYETFDFAANMDKKTWVTRQQALGVLDDGVPGPRTVRALIQAGHTQGLWITRPGD